MSHPDAPSRTSGPSVRPDDIAAEGEPEREYHAGTVARMPPKSTAGGGLVFGGSGRILFVEPVYKPTLDIPGGVALADESPRVAFEREVREELGLRIPAGRLLVVDWVPRHGPWPDGLMFVYDGGHLTDEQVAAIVPPPDELRSVALLTLDEARPRLRPSLARRLAAALDAYASGRTRYLEFGRPR